MTSVMLRAEVSQVVSDMPANVPFTSREISAKCKFRSATPAAVSAVLRSIPGVVLIERNVHLSHVWQKVEE